MQRPVILRFVGVGAVVALIGVLVVVVGGGEEDNAGCRLPEGPATIESLLAFVPDTADNRRYLNYANLGAFLESQGDPELPEDFREVRWVDPPSWLVPNAILESAISRGERDALADEYGISVGEVDHSVSFGTPPAITEILVGTFDIERVDAAAVEFPIWANRHETATAYGETFHSWGEDNEVEADRITDMRPFGVGGRLWATGRSAAFTRTTDAMEELLAGCAGEADTLAADDTFVGLAQRLDAGQGWFNVTLTDDVIRGAEDLAGSEASSDDIEQAETMTYLLGVEAFAFSDRPSNDSDKASIRLVIASGTGAEAAANADLFTEHLEADRSLLNELPWDEIADIESMEVDGRFLVIDLLSDRGLLVANAHFRRDSLVISEN